ncbi:MAG: hypothetical protein ACI9CP_001188, partial [Cryomorphaceae bacterium]
MNLLTALNTQILLGTCLVCFFSIASLAQDKATVKGKITDREGNAIEFANVYVRSQGEGTFTDRYGKFKIELTPGEGILLETTHTSFLGKEETLKLTAGQTQIVNFRLEYREIEGVEIVDDRSRTSPMDKVPIKDIKISPTVQQGIESVLTSQLGVRMNNELSSTYSVRGGSYAENLVYVNDIEVYRPFLARSGEQEGLSFPNPDMVGTINFSAGGFDARYGDRMSSVLDIQYKKPKRFGGSVMASLLGGSISLESSSKDSRFTQVSG